MTAKSRDRLIAGVATLLIAVGIVAALLFLTISYDRSAVAASSVPETGADEELFIDPELLDMPDLGEPLSEVDVDASPSPLGEPETGPENETVVIPGDNPKPAPVEKPVVTQKAESPVKATQPTKTEEKPSKAASEVKNSFSPHNGSSDGKAGATGTGGNSVGVSGTSTGRKFLGCPEPKVTLSHKTTVKVNVEIDENGNVVSASASGSSSKAIRDACVAAARGARWSAKKGSARASGTITFIITPK